MRNDVDDYILLCRNLLPSQFLPRLAEIGKATSAFAYLDVHASSSFSWCAHQKRSLHIHNHLVSNMDQAEMLSAVSSLQT